MTERDGPEVGFQEDGLRRVGAILKTDLSFLQQRPMVVRLF